MSSLNEKKSSSGVRVLKTVLKVIGRSLAIIGVTLLLVLILLVGACFLAMHGPSPAFRSQFAMFAYETSALKWLPRLFLGNDQFEKMNGQKMGDQILHVFDTKIRTDQTIPKAQTRDESIFENYKGSKAQQDFLALAEEFEEEIKNGEKHQRGGWI